jgi:hypothetical protein
MRRYEMPRRLMIAVTRTEMTIAEPRSTFSFLALRVFMALDPSG